MEKRDVMSPESSPGRRLQGKIVLVTGAGKGIGRATAMLFGNEGAHVVLVARTEADIASAADEIGGRGGLGAPIAGDVTDEAFVTRLFKVVKDRFGRLDVLVNCAGVVPMGPLDDFRVADLRRCLEVNVVGVFMCMQQAVRLMQETGDTGKIINVGSVRSHWTEGGGAGAYTASKYAVRALTESVARQLHGTGSKIAVGLLCPGVVDTPLTNPKGEARADWLQPEALAQAALYMATAPQMTNVFDLTLFSTAQKPW